MNIRSLGRTLMMVAAVTMAAVFLASCSNSSTEQANNYINALNQIGAEQNTLASLPAGSPELQQAISTSVPKMQTALDQMNAAQPGLTGEAQTIATGATPEAQKMVNSLQDAATAITAGDDAAAAQALSNFDEASAALQGYVTQWNEQVATQK